MTSNKKIKTSAVESEYTGAEVEDDVPKNATIVRFHSGVTEVSDHMFQGCEYLMEVVFNEGLRKIGYSSFAYCHGLEHINLPSTLLEVNQNAFYACSNLLEAVLNQGLQKIGPNAFAKCRLLKSINLPSTVTEVGQCAFCGCINLKTVTLSESLKTIGSCAFATCTSLEGSITIPSTVTELSDLAFADCRRLREVGLHKGIQSIHRRAFDGCWCLERFMFPNLSTRLDTIIKAGKYVDIEDKIDNIRGIVVERRGNELFVSDVESVTQRWRALKGTLGQIDRVITYYELKEVTTLFELAMWKEKNQAEVKPNVNRDVYRIDIPGPVKNNILQYLNFRV